MLRVAFGRNLVSVWKRCGEIKVTSSTALLINDDKFSKRNFSIGPSLNYSIRKEYAAEKHDRFNIEDNEVELVEGYIDSGIHIPTFETHEMLINGVPFKELPVARIIATKNNTKIHCSDYSYKNRLAYSSCGIEGFKNARKSTAVAAQTVGLSVGYKMVRQGFKDVRVIVAGLGVGRLPAMTGLKQAGLNIVSISDDTPIGFPGNRPRKPKRK